MRGLRARVESSTGAAFALVLLACGSTSETGNSATGGSVSTTGGASSSGGSLSTTGGANSSGGAGVGGDVFNPGVPRPAEDCRSAADYKNCSSVAGTFAGAPVQKLCGLPTSLSVLINGRWLFGCGTGSEPLFQVYVTPRRAGSFFESTVAADSTHPFEVRISQTVDGKVNSASTLDENFVSAELAGVAVKLPNDNIVVSGTLHAVWAQPSASCRPQTGAACAAAEVNGTFSAEQVFGNCIDGSDCASGNCVAQGKTCFKQ